MEVTLSSRQMDELAYKTAVVLAKLLKKQLLPRPIKHALQLLGLCLKAAMAMNLPQSKEGQKQPPLVRIMEMRVHPSPKMLLGKLWDLRKITRPILLLLRKHQRARLLKAVIPAWISCPSSLVSACI